MSAYEEFMKNIVEFYGQYSTEFKKSIIQQYIQDNFRADQLDHLFTHTIAQYSSEYKTPPDVFVFRKLMENPRNEADALKAYEDLNRSLNSYRGIICSDIRVQACLVGMGGWIAFCLRNPEDEVWHRKRFIELFELYTKNKPEMEYQVLPGKGTNGKVVYIGNHKVCVSIHDQIGSSNVTQIGSMEIRQISEVV